LFSSFRLSKWCTEMEIDLRFFASIREQIGTGHERVTLPEHIQTVGELRAWLCHRGESWNQALDGKRPLRMALDQAVATPAMRLHAGCEVAFFPPVTGG
jgi:molybdopterin synthase sulfur carrier subunit